jgi:hypothetical protein
MTRLCVRTNSNIRTTSFASLVRAAHKGKQANRSSPEDDSAAYGAACRADSTEVRRDSGEAMVRSGGGC